MYDRQRIVRSKSPVIRFDSKEDSRLKYDVLVLLPSIYGLTVYWTAGIRSTAEAYFKFFFTLLLILLLLRTIHSSPQGSTFTGTRRRNSRSLWLSRVGS
jgi:hypothetical protein